MYLTDDRVIEIKAMLQPEYNKDLFLNFLETHQVKENLPRAYEIYALINKLVEEQSLLDEHEGDEVARPHTQMLNDLIEVTSLPFELTRQLRRELKDILSPEYNRDLFLLFLEKYNVKENCRISYDILLHLQRFTYTPEEDSLHGVSDYSKMLADLLKETSLTWEQINTCQLNDYEDDDSCQPFPIGAFIAQFFLEQQGKDQYAQMLLEQWKNEISIEDIRALFVSNEYRVLKDYTNTWLDLFDSTDLFPNYEPSIILRTYFLEQYNQELGINELVPLLLNVVRTNGNESYSDTVLEDILKESNPNLHAFLISAKPAFTSSGSDDEEAYGMYLFFCALIQDCVSKPESKVLSRIEQLSGDDALKLGIARFKVLVEEFSYQENIIEQLERIAVDSERGALSSLYEQTPIVSPSDEDDMRAIRGFLYTSLYLVLIASYTRIELLEKFSVILAKMKQQISADRPSEQETAPQTIPPSEAASPEKQEYINKAKNYLHSRRFSSWLIKSGMENIVWFFSPLQWAKVTFTMAFLDTLKKEEAPDLSASYNTMKAKVEQAVSAHKLKKSSCFSFFSCAKPQVEKEVDALNDGKWFKAFNP